MQKKLPQSNAEEYPQRAYGKWPFRESFSSGILRMNGVSDGTMFVGMTARGWGSTAYLQTLGGGVLQVRLKGAVIPFEKLALRCSFSTTKKKEISRFNIM